MLINTPIKQGDIITIKFTSGEEAIARYEEHKSGELTVSKPLMLVQAGEGVGFAPWLFTAIPDQVNLNFAGITAFLKSNEQAAGMYIKQTTGIDLAV